MRVIIAPDSYKGSLSATAVAEAMAQGVAQVFPAAKIIKVPIADGGEGTVEALLTAVGGQVIEEEVQDPIGRPVRAMWGLLADGHTAVIEMAAASGLTLLSPTERAPLTASTYGTGELIRAAMDKGVTKIILGIGGSATNDGGTGMASALGVRFLDKDNRELPPGGAALAQLARIDLQGLDPRVTKLERAVACDVDNPLCGPRGAAAVYGPQKGATPSMVEILDEALGNYARIAEQATGRNIAELPGAGAAGGLGAGLLYFTSAILQPGVELVLATADFDKLVADADFVLTGEGRTDFQTAFGKAPVGVAKAAKKYDVPVFCLSGGMGDGADDVFAHGIDGLISIVDRPLSLEECMGQAPIMVERAAARLCRIIAVNNRVKS